MEHTKGPWEASHNPASEIREGWQIGMWERDVTANTGLGPSATGIGETRGEADANANLIAAAPELLEACKAIGDAMIKTQGFMPHFLEQAIAKAEGK
ncbi:hypothetical protein KAR91_58295 [Candidatus Pacearchaeota archaeon]|nr:hypothetical protein [Candidatus Pacearchaeota archaeon]